MQGSSRHRALSGSLCFSPSSLQRQQILQGTGFPSDFCDLSQSLQQQLVSLPQPVPSLPHVQHRSAIPLACSSTPALCFTPLLVLNFVYCPLLSCLDPASVLLLPLYFQPLELHSKSGNFIMKYGLKASWQKPT